MRNNLCKITWSAMQMASQTDSLHIEFSGTQTREKVIYKFCGILAIRSCIFRNEIFCLFVFLVDLVNFVVD